MLAKASTAINLLKGRNTVDEGIELVLHLANYLVNSSLED